MHKRRYCWPAALEIFSDDGRSQLLVPRSTTASARICDLQLVSEQQPSTSQTLVGGDLELGTVVPPWRQTKTQRWQRGKFQSRVPDASEHAGWSVVQ